MKVFLQHPNRAHRRIFLNLLFPGQLVLLLKPPVLFLQLVLQARLSVASTLRSVMDWIGLLRIAVLLMPSGIGSPHQKFCAHFLFFVELHNFHSFLPSVTGGVICKLAFLRCTSRHGALFLGMPTL